MQNLHPVAQALDFRKNMRREDHAVSVSEFAYQRPGFPDLVGVEAGGGLVHDDDFRIVDDGLGNAHTLLISLGKRADQAPADIFEATAPLGLGERDFLYAAQPCRELEIAVDVHVAVKRRNFGKIAKLALRLERFFPQVYAAQADRTGIGPQVSGKHAHRGAFSCTVRAQKAEHFSPPQFERHVVHGGMSAEGAAQSLRVKEKEGVWHHCNLLLWCSSNIPNMRVLLNEILLPSSNIALIAISSMNPKHISIAVLALLFAACAQQPVKPAQQAKPAELAPAKSALKPAEPKLPDIALSDDLLFEFLLAEIAGQRGNLGIATESYVAMARNTRDPRIVSRALDVALFAGNVADATEMAKLLISIDPSSEKAKQTLSALLAHSGNLQEAKPNLEKLLARQSGQNLAKSLLELDTIFAKQTDRKAVLSAVKDLTKPYLDHPEAHYAIAIAAWRAGQNSQAIDETDKASSMRPGWEMAALLKAHILEQTDRKAVEPFLADFLDHYPKSPEVRLSYAKFLVSEKKFQQARKEFETLKKAFPENQEVGFAVGLLSLQLGDTNAAISDFKDLLERHFKNPDLARYYIGQAYEMEKSPADAMEWYVKVGEGPQYLLAQVRVAVILSKREGIGKARRYLHGIHASNPQEKMFLVQAEAELLHEARDYRSAYAVLEKGIEDYPDSPNLLYAHAMAAEKIGKIRETEKSLKRLIGLEPDYAQAYNALGYTLIEHTRRYKEALPLLQKALALAPEDPFILDSMGWLQYKMGNMPSSLDYLTRAYSGRQDPEIAAHLVEVLWTQGKRDEAKKLLQSSLKAHPDNEMLLRSMKRIQP